MTQSIVCISARPCTEARNVARAAATAARTALVGVCGVPGAGVWLGIYFSFSLRRTSIRARYLTTKRFQSWSEARRLRRVVTRTTESPQRTALENGPPQARRPWGQSRRTTLRYQSGRVALGSPPLTIAAPG